MEGNVEKLHDILLRMGFKVLACPDNEEKPEVNTTIYGDKTGRTVIVEEPDEKQIMQTLKSEHPVTGDTTSEEAAGLLKEELVNRDAR